MTTGYSGKLSLKPNLCIRSDFKLTIWKEAR